MHFTLQICLRLVLAASDFKLPLPPPAELVNSIQSLLMNNLDAFINNLIPAISIALIIRKLTS